MNIKFNLAIATLVLSCLSFAQEADKRETPAPPERVNLYLGAGVGTFFPSSSLTRDVFGSQSSFFNFGAVLPNRRGLKGFGFDGIGGLIQGNGNQALFFGGAYGYEWQFGRTTSNAMTYVRLGAGGALSIIDIDSPLVGGSLKKTSLLGALALETGVVLGQRTTLSAHYNLFSKAHGLNFSGLTVQLNIAVFKL